MKQSGETNLATLLSSMSPTLDSEVYVFCSVDGTSSVHALATIQEAEGMTLVVTLEVARQNGWSTSVKLRRITLMVHSSLEAVGLTAAVASSLANNGISANVIAGYYHDHIFVPAADADRAVEILNQLSQGA